jgi:hypothetical protein
MCYLQVNFMPAFSYYVLSQNFTMAQRLLNLINADILGTAVHYKG